MRKTFSLLACTAAAVLAVYAQSGPRPELTKPKLVVGIVIDQFRFDYLNRFRADYTGGLARFFREGAVFTNAHQDHFPTVTAIGHSTFMSGATPSISGIVNNQWYDRTTGKVVTSVSDDSVQVVGGSGKGASPHRLLASTVGDELKMSHDNAKVIGISIKDRAAILPAGHMADGAYWLDSQTGNFISSTFYFPDLPAWVKKFNEQHGADHYAGAEWKAFDSDRVFTKLPSAPGPQLYASLESTPFGNELIEKFAEQAIDSEQLGKDDETDLLTVSFSANDYVGHRLGPDAPEVRDISIRTDRLLEHFFQFLDRRIGLNNVLIVLTGDHGVAPVPELDRTRKMPGGRLDETSMLNAVQAALTSKYGEGKWITADVEHVAYLNWDLIRQKNLRAPEVERVAADVLRQMPEVFRVYTREQLLFGAVPPDPISQRVIRGFYPPRSGDILVLANPYYIYEKRGTSHGTPFNYDTHVPVMFLGPNVRPGRYDSRIAVNDIAVTLAAMLDIEIPSGAVGRVLSEMFPKLTAAAATTSGH
jgi:predicted AlkP superfamily pyrophosphatase or phosphodiesterase